MSEEYLQFLGSVMPIITAALVAVFAMIAFLFQKNIERGLKYREEVERRYESYLHAIFDVMAKPTEDNHAEFAKMRASLRIFAPLEVLKIAKEFEDHATRVKIVDEPQNLAASLLYAMRKDVTPKRRFGYDLTVEQMQQLNSFSLN